MNSLVKEKSSSLKDLIKNVVYDIELTKEKIDIQRKYIRDVENLSNDQVDLRVIEIEAALADIEKHQEENALLSNEIDERQNGLKENLKASNDKKQSLLQFKAEFNQKIKVLVKETKFYEENADCPTCSQTISEDLRSEKLSVGKEKATELQNALNDVSDQSTKVEQDITKFNTITDEIRDRTTTISGNNREITRLQGVITASNEAIQKIQGTDGDLSVEKKSLETLVESRNDLTETKLVKNEELSYNLAMAEMLKDTGIKTKIVKEYLPVINKLTNQYLQILDFFVHFNLDESFQETIRSRHRDNFSYDSFSEGEKQRIDLALLFTWRQIAKMKNSVATNLLILDETFDSSLDHEGVGNLMKIIYSLGDDANVFVISHKGEILDDKFEGKIEFTKEKNFSKIK
jgi:hypothetical protein